MTLGGTCTPVAAIGLLAQRYQRAGTHLYAVAVPITHVPEILPVPDPDLPMDGNRRVSVRHARDFAEYWTGNQSWVTPPLLVDTPLLLDDHFTAEFESEGLQAGVLRLPSPERSALQILDGQHRVLGWSLLRAELGTRMRVLRDELYRARDSGSTAQAEAALAELKQIEDQRRRLREEWVTVEILQGVELDDHKQYFFDIAANAKGISKSLSAGFDKREVLNRVARVLSEEHPLLRDRVDPENDRVGARRGVLLSMRNVADLTAAVMLGTSGWITRRHAPHLADGVVRDAVEQFLDSLTGSFDSLQDVADDTISPGQLRDESLLGSVTILRALAAAFHAMAVRQGRVTADGEDLARRVWTMLAPEMGLPISDLWWASRAFSSRDARAPGARRQDLQNLVDLVLRIADEVAQHIPPAPPKVGVPRAPEPTTPISVSEPAARSATSAVAGLVRVHTRGNASNGQFTISAREGDAPPQRLAGRAPADVVGDHLHRIGRFRLLSAEEEVALAKAIEAGVLARERLDADQGLQRRLRRELSMVEAEGERARDRMIVSNLRLVVSIAKRYQGNGLELADLIQEGTLGLIRAVEKFDYRAGNKFSTYATWWVRQAVTRAIADQGRLIRLPVHVVEDLNTKRRQLRLVHDELWSELGRQPTAAEVAEASGLTIADVDGVRQLTRSVWSLEELVPAVGDEWRDGEWDGARWVVRLGDLIPDDDAPDLAEGLVFEDLQNALTSILGTLPEREVGIVIRRHGYLGDPMTLEQVGAVYGVTRERIRQLEKKAMARLRRRALTRRLESYLDLPPDGRERLRAELVGDGGGAAPSPNG